MSSMHVPGALEGVKGEISACSSRAVHLVVGLGLKFGRGAAVSRAGDGLPLGDCLVVVDAQGGDLEVRRVGADLTSLQKSILK
jgi:hypothetical protein